MRCQAAQTHVRQHPKLQHQRPLDNSTPVQAQHDSTHKRTQVSTDQDEPTAALQPTKHMHVVQRQPTYFL